MQINHDDLEITSPHNILAEQSVLGAILLDNSVLDLVVDLICEFDFYVESHRVIFSAITALLKEGKPCDSITVSNVFENHDDKKNLASYVFEISAAAFTTANAIAYAEIVRETSIRRQLLGAANEIVQAIYHGDKKVPDLLDQAEKKIFAVSNNEKLERAENIQTVLTDVINYISTLSDNFSGLHSGFAALDLVTQGFQPGDLIIVAARPAMGKTSFSMNIAEHVATNHGAVLFFSLEMTKRQLGLRLLSTLSEIDQSKLRSAKLDDAEWKKIFSTMNKIENNKLIIDDTPTLSPQQLRAKARRVAKKNPLSLIIVDYLQLMHAAGFENNATGEVSEISRSLKSLARELNVPVIALSQLNRNLEQRPDKRPLMSDLRQSGAIEQDADLILFLYRDEVYSSAGDKGVAEVLIAKHRHGPTGRVKLRFDGKKTQFSDFAARGPMGDFEW